MLIFPAIPLAAFLTWCDVVSCGTGVRADAQVLGANAREEDHVHGPDQGAEQHAAAAAAAHRLNRSPGIPARGGVGWVRVWAGEGGAGDGWGNGDDFARRPRMSWRDEEGDVRISHCRGETVPEEAPETMMLLLRLSLPFTSPFILILFTGGWWTMSPVLPALPALAACPRSHIKPFPGLYCPSWAQVEQPCMISPTRETAEGLLRTSAPLHNMTSQRADFQ